MFYLWLFFCRNNFLLRDHHLRVDVCQQRGGHHGASGKQQNKDENRDECSIFIGSLPLACDEEKLRAHFSVLKSEDGEEEDVNDKIVNVRVIRDRYSGLGKGFGYVQYNDKALVKRAVEEKNGSKFEGRKLRVTISSPDAAGGGGDKNKKTANVPNNKKGMKQKNGKPVPKIKKEEESMLRRKWFFKAGTSKSAGKSTQEVKQSLRGEKKNFSQKSPSSHGPNRKHGSGKKFHKKKFRPTNMK